MKQPPVNIKNKRATFDYELIDTYTAGVVLTGTEIKSIRLGKASLVDTFCYFVKGELWVKNMHIAELSTKKVWRNWSLLWRKVRRSMISGNP